MAQKPSIAKNVSAEQVTLKVPHELQSAIDARRLTHGRYIVVAFPGMRTNSGSIVDSSTLAKVLAKLEGESGTIVAVAHDFTAEARALLETKGAIRFNQHDFFWTDASLANVRQRAAK